MLNQKYHQPLQAYLYFFGEPTSSSASKQDDDF